MDTKQEILTFLKDKKEFLKDNFHVTKVALFGSFAKDKQTSSSDIDLLIELESNITNIHDIKTSLKNYLTKSLKRDVDLAREKYLKPYAKKHILKEALYV